MQGTVVRVAASEGQRVDEGDLIAVVEAMKMEQPLIAHSSGVVRELAAEVGTTLVAGALVCRLVAD